MLTESLLKSLKPGDKQYRVSDKEGLYVVVLPSGTKSFRYNYRIHGRNETITIGKWKDDISLKEARDRLVDIKRVIASGVSPMVERKRLSKQSAMSGTVKEWVDRFFEWSNTAESTKARRRFLVEAQIFPRWGNRKLEELPFEDIRSVVDEVSNAGAPATAIEIRTIMAMVFDFAIDRGGYVGENPARRIKPASVHVFKPRERALSGREIATFYECIKFCESTQYVKLGLKLLLLTMLRKSELLSSTWDDVDFEACTLTIPKEHTKLKRTHIVYLSTQAVEILKGLKLVSNGAPHILPSRCRYLDQMSGTAFNRAIILCVDIAKKNGWDLERFSPHDLRRTASTLLHEAGFNSDVIEKCLAHEQGGVRAIYNKAEYAQQRRELLQAWADMIDSFSEKYKDQLTKVLQ